MPQARACRARVRLARWLACAPQTADRFTSSLRAQAPRAPLNGARDSLQSRHIKEVRFSRCVAGAGQPRALFLARWPSARAANCHRPFHSSYRARRPALAKCAPIMPQHTKEVRRSFYSRALRRARARPAPRVSANRHPPTAFSSSSSSLSSQHTRRSRKACRLRRTARQRPCGHWRGQGAVARSASTLEPLAVVAGGD